MRQVRRTRGRPRGQTLGTARATNAPRGRAGAVKAARGGAMARRAFASTLQDGGTGSRSGSGGGGDGRSVNGVFVSV